MRDLVLSPRFFGAAACVLCGAATMRWSLGANWRVAGYWTILAALFGWVTWAMGEK